MRLHLSMDSAPEPVVSASPVSSEWSESTRFNLSDRMVEESKVSKHAEAQEPFPGSRGHIYLCFDGCGSVGEDEQSACSSTCNTASCTTDAGIARSQPCLQLESTTQSDLIDAGGQHADMTRPTMQIPNRSRSPTLFWQPDSKPISLGLLVKEIEEIYAGLATTEAKCVEVDSRHAVDLPAVPDQLQWQSLLALHRTLLYEHHDFLLATQHPSATLVLQCLPSTYGTLDGMWFLAIHPLLELLRSRMPQSYEYLLAFIYLAYHMLAALLESVPMFAEIWLERLGDLARYRNGYRKLHRGKLYHNLGLLERPSLRKLHLYFKALNCQRPFVNTHQAITNFAQPIVADEKAIKELPLSPTYMQARIVIFHLVAARNSAYDDLENLAGSTVQLWSSWTCEEQQSLGAYLAITNIASLFDLGDKNNALWQAFSIGRLQSSGSDLDAAVVRQSQSKVFNLRKKFTYSLINSALRRYGNNDVEEAALHFVHPMLVWVASLVELRLRVKYSTAVAEIADSLLSPSLISWSGLCDLLNSLGGHRLKKLEPIDGERRLAEDFIMRGLTWSVWYLCDKPFDAYDALDPEPLVDSEMVHIDRKHRVYWLGLYLASNTEHIDYDCLKHRFSTRQSTDPQLFASKPKSEVEFSQAAA